MGLTKTDEIKIPPEALEYIEEHCGEDPFNYEVIEAFFEWLRMQNRTYIVMFLREALVDE